MSCESLRVTLYSVMRAQRCENRVKNDHVPKISRVARAGSPTLNVSDVSVYALRSYHNDINTRICLFHGRGGRVYRKLNFDDTQKLYKRVGSSKRRRVRARNTQNTDKSRYNVRIEFNYRRDITTVIIYTFMYIYGRPAVLHVFRITLSRV